MNYGKECYQNRSGTDPGGCQPDHRRASGGAYVLEKLKETKTATPASDLLFGLFPIQEGNPYREIVNISAYVSAAMSEAWRLFFEVEHLRRELAELKGREIEDVKCTVV